MATKSIKKWLQLPRNNTRAILYHLKALNVSIAQNIKVKAKLSLLVALNRDTDHLIQELRPLLSSESFTQGVLDIAAACASIFKAVSESITSLPALKKQCKEQLTSMTTQHWDNHLQTLQVQKKFADIVAFLRGGESLMEENHEKRANQWSAVLPPQGWLGYLPNPYEFTYACIFSMAHSVLYVSVSQQQLTSSMAASLPYSNTPTRRFSVSLNRRVGIV